MGARCAARPSGDPKRAVGHENSTDLTQPIRRERAPDHRGLCHRPPHADGDEAALVARLRHSATYRSADDVVALSDDGTLIGHALLSQAAVVGPTHEWPVFVLAPLAVHPDWQGQGVGSALLTYLAVQAGEDARRAIAILGDPGYYGRFGYQPARDFGVTAPFAVPDANLMLKAIVPGGLTGVSGTLRYDPAFGL
ncbi:GNAT family N-acetyltransferase [Lacticaseibacillus absianus]|uniref:GNAT family N-acetyltransferase n=1 Tax=Lacticaseibacillus absianus TaxID=2729623 RepID=UPI0015CB31D0|nr:N-acetyltransferase [Lacticaseibacillus absianus]